MTDKEKVPAGPGPEWVQTGPRGHDVRHLGNGEFVWADTGEPYETSYSAGRPCAKCERPPTKEGFDACLRRLPGVVAACCGHGKDEGYLLFENGVAITLPVNPIIEFRPEVAKNARKTQEEANAKRK
jgi:hypothetical protein